MKFLQIGSENELSHHVKIINQYAQSVIDKRKSTSDGVLQGRADLLSRFLTYGKEHNEALSDTLLRDIIINFLIAGRDTTAVLLTWSTYELTQHPEWEEKLLAAIRERKVKVSERRKGGDVNDASNEFDDFQSISHLPVLQAFLHECLRLHPPVPADGKEPVKDDTLPDGTFVCISILSMYHAMLYYIYTSLQS
jgi:cytochrome P450